MTPRQIMFGTKMKGSALQRLCLTGNDTFSVTELKGSPTSPSVLEFKASMNDASLCVYRWVAG